METDFQATQPLIVCPNCDVGVGYDDVEESDCPDQAKCPVCEVSSPTEEWFQ
jgi:rubredoxin